MSVRLTLDVVRARLARHQVACPPGCGACCGPVPVGTIEARRAGISPGLTDVVPGTLTCTHLDGDKRCDIHAERPLICRFMGAVERLPCPIGLTPANGCMPPKEAREIENWAMRRVELDPPLREVVELFAGAVQAGQIQPRGGRDLR